MTPFAWALCFVGIPIGLGFTLPKLFVLVLCVWRQGWDGARFPRRLRWAVGACFAVLLLSTVFSVDPVMSLSGHFDSWAYGVLACSLYAAVLFMAIKNPPSRRGLGWLAVALSVHAVLQQFGLDPIMGPAVNLPAHRSISYIGTPFDLGTILAMLFFVCGSRWQRACVGVGIVVAGARGGALGVAAGAVAERWPRLARPVMGLSLLCFLAPAHLAKDLARREVWLAALSVWRHYPILGSGPDTFIKVFDGQHLAAMQSLLTPMATQAQAHNDILQALATTGLLGLAAYLWLVLEIPASPSIVALFVCMKFDPAALEVLAIGAMLAGLAISERKTT